MTDPQVNTYPRPEPPADLAPLGTVTWAGGTYQTLDPGRCKNESPAWGWEGEGEECLRMAHPDPWHYFRDEDLEMWWQSR